MKKLFERGGDSSPSLPLRISSGLRLRVRMTE